MDKKIFDIEIDDSDFSPNGIFQVSLVKSPAIESDFMYFSKDGEFTERQQLYHFNEEKREVVGAVLIPDKLIYRYSKEIGEYYVRFSKEVIESLVYKMSKDNVFNMFNIEHNKESVGNVFVTEQWIKESEEDKSSKYSKLSDLAVGTLFMKCKIDNDEVWNEIKDGELKGFSVELNSYIIPSNFKQMKEKETNVFSAEDVKLLVDEVTKAINSKKTGPILTENVEQLASASYWSLSSNGNVYLETEAGTMYFVAGEDTVDMVREALTGSLNETKDEMHFKGENKEDTKNAESTTAATAKTVNKTLSEEKKPEANTEPYTEDGTGEPDPEAKAEAVAEPEKEAGVILSEEEATEQLLSDQKNANEPTEEELNETKTVINRSDPRFKKALKEMFKYN